MDSTLRRLEELGFDLSKYPRKKRGSRRRRRQRAPEEEPPKVKQLDTPDVDPLMRCTPVEV